MDITMCVRDFPPKQGKDLEVALETLSQGQGDHKSRIIIGMASEGEFSPLRSMGNANYNPSHTKKRAIRPVQVYLAF